jgi:AraC-like DNA-binding protein
MTRVNNNISAIAVLDLAKELRQLHILDHESLVKLESKLADSSKQADVGIELELRSSEELLVNLWRLVAKSSKCPEVGILIGSKVNNDAKGVLGNWISQCQTLAEAFSVFKDNIALLNAAENWTLERYPEHIKLIFKFSSIYQYPIAAIERSMSALVMWSSDLSGGPIAIESAHFMHAAPAYKNLYSSIFGSDITFSTDENSLLLKTSTFEKPIINANKYLQYIVAARAKKVLADSLDANQKLSFSARVRGLLFSDLKRFNSIESVCKEMHMSRTSLYRKLKLEGKSFRQILDEVQFEKYQQGLKQGLAASDICELLGYSDPSTFYKARKRWEKWPD